MLWLSACSVMRINQVFVLCYHCVYGKAIGVCRINSLLQHLVCVFCVVVTHVRLSARMQLHKGRLFVPIYINTQDILTM